MPAGSPGGTMESMATTSAAPRLPAPAASGLHPGPAARTGPGVPPVGQIAIVGGRRNKTNGYLLEHWGRLGLPVVLAPTPAELESLRPDDVALGRIDVLPTVDGTEPGLLGLLLLERRGVRVLNTAFALLNAHDKLLTARRLVAAGVPHPRTGVVRHPDDPLPVRPPLVVKPRFGSWGVDVERCTTEQAARMCLRRLARRAWFARHGALVQELLPPQPRDLRVLVAAGRVIGAMHRVAAPGEWRTNVALGGTAELASPDAETTALALAAAAALGCDLVAVDLMPVAGGGHVVLELNGAADFDAEYTPAERDVFRDAAVALRLYEPGPAHQPPR
jgi:[lysine-biosynthesis-protein LysW]--L-2-aminoadipate ligase